MPLVCFVHDMGVTHDIRRMRPYQLIYFQGQIGMNSRKWVGFYSFLNKNIHNSRTTKDLILNRKFINTLSSTSFLYFFDLFIDFYKLHIFTA